MMAAVVNRLGDDFDTTILDLSPGQLERSLRYHWVRWRQHFRAARVLSRRRSRADVAYISVPGGWGMAYLGLLLPLIRWRCAVVYLHHDNYSYIAEHRRLAAACFRLAGAGATHIALCDLMADQLRRGYNVSDVLIVANSWAVAGSTALAPRLPGNPVRLAHMSNLSLDKGLGRTLQIFRALKEQHDVVLEIAGPIADAAARGALEDAVGEFGDRIHYWGPLYGANKSEFLSGTDVFLFPSAYRNEAQPLVLEEALSHGAFVVASAVGCTAALGEYSPIVQVAPPEDLAALIESAAKAVVEVAANRPSAAKQARAFAKDRQRVATRQIDALVEHMVSPHA